MEFIILGLIIYFIISWFIAMEFEAVANQKGYSESKYFWYPFLFGIAGYLLVIALPPKETCDQPADGEKDEKEENEQ